MSEEGISPAVRGFIADYINSVLQLEILLLLARGPDQTWTAHTVSQELRVDEVWTAAHLATSCSQGLLNCSNTSPAVYQFAPTTLALRNAVTDVAKTYADRRVSVIGLIFSKPMDSIRSFADAFRFRKDKPSS